MTIVASAKKTQSNRVALLRFDLIVFKMLGNRRITEARSEKERLLLLLVIKEEDIFRQGEFVNYVRMILNTNLDLKIHQVLSRKWDQQIISSTYHHTS